LQTTRAIALYQTAIREICKPELIFSTKWHPAATDGAIGKTVIMDRRISQTAAKESVPARN